MDYTVKTRITPSNPQEPNEKYKKVCYTGEFISKGKRVKHCKIEEQVKTYLKGKLSEQNPGLSFNIEVVKIERSNKAFIVVEDKLEEGN
ncbi:MAG: hypothetical protein N4A74_21575 [Carboxylicivirga sp.]|jgi:hypothetical protein|nr:hypothetical protein [Carboxylicivirga sp.]